MYLSTMEYVNKCLFGKFSKWMMAAGVMSQMLNLIVEESEEAAGGLKQEVKEFGVVKEESSVL